MAGFQFGFVCFQRFAGRKSFPPFQTAPRARRLDRCVAPAKASIREIALGVRCPTASELLGRATSPICDSRRRLDLPASGTTSGGGVSGRAWPRRILVIGGRRKRVARLHIFRNRISQISQSGPQMRFRTRLLVSCHSRVSGNPGPRHVWPSLDARFRGHDTDVSESSPHFQRLRRPV